MGSLGTFAASFRLVTWMVHPPVGSDRLSFSPSDVERKIAWIVCCWSFLNVSALRRVSMCAILIPFSNSDLIAHMNRTHGNALF